MLRYIRIQDNNKRDADINFKSVKTGNLIYLALENGEKPTNRKIDIARGLKIKILDQSSWLKMLK